MTDAMHEYGVPVRLSLGWVSQGDSGDDRGVCVTVKDDSDRHRLARLWFSRQTMGELLANKGNQPGRWETPDNLPALPPSEFVIYGRWCPKCEAMVPASHTRDMLQIPIRQTGHDWFPLFRRSEDG